MKSENNGKIAIAIVAMFVVALSVVGFTYAYFTAQVQGNTATKSVEVTAGRLEVVYAQSNKLEAENVVPGWISDGAHYYDPVYSKGEGITSGNTTVYPITAVTTTDTVNCKDGNGEGVLIKNCQDSSVKSPAKANGITNPVAFSVNNTNNNTADNKYIVRLTNISNSFGADDQQNVKVTLKSGNTVIWSGTLASSGTQIIVPAAETLAANNASGNNYTIYLTYVNVNASQNDPSNEGVMNSAGKTITATADIVGVVNNGTNWVDGDGNIISFPGYESGLNSYTDYSVAPNNGISAS